MMLLLTDTNYPGWHASVDSKPVEIVNGFYTFRAVPVPRGVHTVVFQFTPESFSLGLILSMISIVGLGAYIALMTNGNTGKH